MTSKISGIYKLTNKINGKIYIGKAINLKNRINDYIYGQHRIKEKPRPIVSAIKKYGWNNFNVEILQSYQKIDNITLLSLETAFIDYFKCLTTQHGYNVCLFGNDRTGTTASQKTKLAISSWWKRARKEPEKTAIFLPILGEKSLQKRLPNKEKLFCDNIKMDE